MERLMVTRARPEKPRLLALIRLRWSVRLLRHGSLISEKSDPEHAVICTLSPCVSVLENAMHARNNYVFFAV
jgi:hypothetical protein